MKVKFSLQRAAGAVDLITTVDSATTVGQLAQYLATADPATRHAVPPEDLTLGLVGTGTLALDPAQLVADSGVRSGATLALNRGGGSLADPHRAAAAVVHVLDGPDAGREYEVPSGSSIIGREPGCEVRLTDVMVSRRHARINISEVVEIIDLGSANGVLIEGVAMPRCVLRAADVVQLGDSRLSVRMLRGVGSTGQPQRTATGFVRSPRLDPVGRSRKFEAPEPPERQSQQRLSMIPLLAPLLVGGLLYLITHSITAILFVTLSPIMIIGNLAESRLSGRAAYRQALKDFWAEVASLTDDASKAVTAEISERLREHPSTAECVDAARTATPLLWTRRPGERGFAEVRLGLGRLGSRIEIELPSTRQATRALSRELAQRLAPFAAVDGVPVVAALADSALGMTGPHQAAAPVARALVMQLVALHSPAELILSAVVSPGSAADWEWLKWLPHTTSTNTPLPQRHLAASPASAAALVSSLEELLDQRRRASEPAGPSLALVVDNDAPVERSRLVQLAEHGPAHQIFILWIAAEPAQLPAACTRYVDVHADGVTGTVAAVRAGLVTAPVALESCPADTAVQTARLLAPLVDVGARIDDASDLPRALSLLAVNGPELAWSPEAVLERWTENRSIITGRGHRPARPATADRCGR